MKHARPVVWTTLSEGAIRVVIAGAVLLFLLLRWAPQDSLWAFAAVLLGAGSGLVSILRPGLPAKSGLVLASADALALGLLVWDTGGGDSPLLPLYFAAALALIRPAAEIEENARMRLGVVAAPVVLVGGYLLATVPSNGPSGSSLARSAFEAVLLALLCALAVRLGFGLRSVRRRAEGLSATIAAERDRVDRSDARSGALGSALCSLPVESALELAAEAARVSVGASYSHVASLKGDLHRTVMTADSDACPSWWHPSVQRLLLWSCREGGAVRWKVKVHGLKELIAVPVGSSDGEPWGAVIVGGDGFGAREEQALIAFAAAVSPALDRPPDACGGVDLSSGLPNAASMARVVRQADGRPFSVLAVEARSHPYSTQEELIRRLGERLRGNGQRIFRHAEDTLLVLLDAETDAAMAGKARSLARIVAAEMAAVGGFESEPSVGFAFGGSKASGRQPGELVSAALGALGEARVRGGGIAGAPSGPTTPAAKLAVDLPSVRGLARATAAHDPYLAEHAVGVSRIARRIGRALSLTEEELDILAVGGLLHDVGKIGVPDAILRKPGSLDEEEYAAVKRHPTIGAEIVSELPELSPVVPAILHHHERFDGSGYPDGLGAESIPLIARVVAVADAFDSMNRERPYGGRLSAQAALTEVRRNSGTQFDPQVAEALSRAVRGPDDPRADLAV